MADEHGVFPGEAESSSDPVAGRGPDRWLDRATAERLLSGESLEPVDAPARERAERLARTLAALSEAPPPDDELPGEAAALAAFRKARADREDDRVSERAGERPGGRAALGLVRIGGPAPAGRRRRRGRTVRLGLAAVLTVGMVGGVAVAATTGVLPTPFGGTEPEPATSVTAPSRPLAPSPSAPGGESTPDGVTGVPDLPDLPDHPDHPDAPRGTAREGAIPDAGGGRRSDVLSACRDLRFGKPLSPGRRHALESVAGGSAQVGEYCADVLPHGRTGNGSGAGNGPGGAGTGRHKSGGGNHRGDDLDRARGDGKEDRDPKGGKGDDTGDGRDDGGHRGGRQGGHHGSGKDDDGDRHRNGGKDDDGGRHRNGGNGDNAGDGGNGKDAPQGRS